MLTALNKIIDTVPLPAFIFDKDLGILNANLKGLEMVHCSLQQIRKYSIDRFFPDLKLHADTQGKNVEASYVDVNLHKHHIIANYVIFPDEDSSGIIYVIDKSSHLRKDFISEEYELENQKRIQFTNSVLNNIPADIAVFDADHKYLFINSHGISNEETRKWLIGKDDLDYCRHRGLDEAIAKERHKLFVEAIRTKEHVDWIDEYVREDKTTYVLRRFHPYIVDGELIYMIGYGIDITELKSTQAAAAKNELRNQLILKSALDAIVMIDTDSKITFWNPQAESMFGWKSEDVLGKGLTEIIIPETKRPLYEKGFERNKSSVNGIVFNKLLELEAINRDGEEFPIELTIIPIDDSLGQLNFCAFIRDISYRKNKEKEIANQNRVLQNKNIELEQFTYITSHDLQEPLLTLMSFSELLLEEYSEKLDDEGKMYIQFINKSAVRMRALVAGLMEYARIGRREEVTVLDTNVLVQEVLHDLDAKIRLNRAIIDVENLPEIRGHVTFLRLLFQNLISNAIKFQKAGISPKITIRGCENEEEWAFSVSDNGIGIAEKNKNLIFTIFKKLNKQDQYEGHGIGLAHGKKIVDLHNGEIWVDSALDEGSTFYFTISKTI